MSDVPLPEGAPSNEWIRSVARATDEDEQTVRAIVSASNPGFQPDDSEKEGALKGVFTDVYYKTSETPSDGSPQGRAWVQFPYDGELGAHYEYYCANPPYSPPERMAVTGGRSWTYVMHTVTKVDTRVREVMRDIEHVKIDSERMALRSEFGHDRITIARGVDHHPDFSTAKRILTEGFGIDIADVRDAWGKFYSERHRSRVYWNEGNA